MLIYYQFNNFCSFYNECEFSMCVPTGNTKEYFNDNYTEKADRFDLLKSAVIVGENAGGKTNFIRSLKYLKSLFLLNGPVKSRRQYINATSLMKEKHPIQKFKLCVRVENKKVYIYELHLNEFGIVYEMLQVMKESKGTTKTIFEIERAEDGEWRSLIQNTGGLSMNSSLFSSGIGYGANIGLFISKYALLGDEDALAVVDWINNVSYVELAPVENYNDAIKLDADMRILEDGRYLEIFRMVDDSICGIEVDKQRPYSESIIVRKDRYGNYFRRELQTDSSSVCEFFAWAVHIFRIVYENKVVFADGMDRVLNSVLLDKVVAFVNGAEHTDS